MRYPERPYHLGKQDWPGTTQGFEHLSRAIFTQPRVESEPETPKREEVSQMEVSQTVPQQENQISTLAASQKDELLPLDSPERIAVFRYRGQARRHIFRRFTSADWDSCFAHVIAEFKREKKGFTQIVDMDYASLVLYSKTIQRVEGYTTSDGREPQNLPDWPECVPQHHRLLAMRIIMDVMFASEADDSILQAEGPSVMIDAKWNEAEPGDMKQYFGRVHHFSYPTARHHSRLLRAKSRAHVAGGSRDGTTVIPSGHGVLVSLYDDLIRRVEGYSILGRELNGREEIVREMDAFHKSAVVAQLFKTSLGLDEENAEKE